MRAMAVEPQARAWETSFAERTRGGAGDAIAAILAFASATDVISFAGGFPDPLTFPGKALAEIHAELVESGDVTPFQYSPTRGLPGPRDYVASRVERLDGRRPDDAELLLTSGAIEALELLGKAFLDEEDAVVVEAPTYLGGIMAFESFQTRVHGVALDDGGMRVDELEALLAGGLRPKLVYTIPDHQNPSGVSLSPERRSALVELARRHGFLVVEDVAYRELRYSGEQAPSLWSLAPDAVVQIGTFSKTFVPGVRLGWAVGPAEVVAKLTWAKQNTDQCAGALGQRLLEEYGRRGRLDAQIARACDLYRGRRDALLAALEAHLGGAATWTRSEGGFFSWVELEAPHEAVPLADRALAEGVAIVPGGPFFPEGGGERHLRISFSLVSEAEIDEGIRRVGALVHG
jgi:2-aminoadipate transaminase